MIKLVLSLALLWTSTLYAQRPLGTFTLGVTVAGPSGFTTHRFKVDCPDVPVTPSSGLGEIAVSGSSGTIHEVDVFLSGHDGGNWFSKSNPTGVSQFYQDLQRQGHVVVQVRYLGGGWFHTPPGVRSGFTRLACRPATVFKWIQDHIAAPANATLTIIGPSAGSSQLGYALSSYGTTCDRAVLVVGPPFARICEGCLQQPGLKFDPGWAMMWDTAEGYPAKTGPCYLANAGFCDEETADSVEMSGTRYSYPNVRVYFIVGKQDSPSINNRATVFYNTMASHGQTPGVNLFWHQVTVMAHSIQRSTEGLNYLENLLLQP